MSAEVVLRDMRDDEFDAYADEQLRQYVASLTGVVPTEQAMEKARSDWRRLLPEGLATEHHRLMVAENAGGETVGKAWLAMREPRTGSAETAWLHDIRVEAAHRRSGYGRAILAAVESLARDAGALRLGLNVFADNEVALALYESSGYRVTSQQMDKPLR